MYSGAFAEQPYGCTERSVVRTFVGRDEPGVPRQIFAERMVEATYAFQYEIAVDLEQ